MIKTWYDKVLLALLAAVTLTLTVTALFSLGGNVLGGKMLLAHMMASGLLVIGLPLCAVVWLRHFYSPDVGRAKRLLLLWLIGSGLATIATVFACMLPIASTETMHALIHWHGYAGYAMSIAVAILVVAWYLGRKKGVGAEAS